MKPRSFYSLIFFIGFCSFAGGSLWAQIPAFPGAYGFGSSATGGRGGTVYHVTNLNDSGPGSFRDAVSVGHRIVVFDVGGYIVLDSPVSVASNITIAGQTSPGDGIGIMGAEVSLSNQSNIIMRDVRIRQGTLDPLKGKSALNMGDGSDIILDHCSFEYGQWDSVDAVHTQNFTVQNSIIADPIEQQFGAHVEVGPSTFYRNLWVNAHNRQPLSKDDTQYINNIVYDYQLGYTAANTGGHFSHDLIGNYFIAGPATTNPEDAFFQMNSNQSAYAIGNMLDATTDGILNGSPYNTVGDSIVLTAPWASTTASIPTVSAEQAFYGVTASSGAFPRDSVDGLAVENVLSLGTQGQLYKDQAVTGLPNDGYGNLTGATPFANTSGDGIADYWAKANGISISDPNAGSLPYRNSGYSNLEAYINSLVLPAPWSEQDLSGSPMQEQISYNPFTKTWMLVENTSKDTETIDSGLFASQPLVQDGSITARLLSSHRGQLNGEAGVMLRESDSGNVPYVALAKDSSGRLSLYWRRSTGSSEHALRLFQVRGPIWLRLVKRAKLCIALISIGGSHWIPVGAVDVAMPTNAQAGLISTSNLYGVRGGARFMDVSVAPE